MARRVALTLAYLGGLLFLLASAWTALGFELICLGGCDKSRIPELIVTMGLPYYGRLLLPGVAAMTIAWIICLAQLRRAQWSRMYRSVLFWPLLLAGLSGFGLVAVWVVLASVPSESVWVIYPAWMVALFVAILLTLVGDTIVIVAGHRLRRAGYMRQAPSRVQ
jgi:hypothetical protein